MNGLRWRITAKNSAVQKEEKKRGKNLNACYKIRITIPEKTAWWSRSGKPEIETGYLPIQGKAT